MYVYVTYFDDFLCMHPTIMNDTCKVTTGLKMVKGIHTIVKLVNKFGI